MCSIIKWRNPTAKQTLVAVPVMLQKFGAGMILGFTSCFLTAIQAPHSDIHMDRDTFSWFASSFLLSANIGFCAGSLMMARFGRKLCFIINNVPALVGLFMTYLATDVTALMIGRILQGITLGSNVLVGIVIVGECSSPGNRGMFLTVVTASLNVGSLVVHTCGYYLPWRSLVLIITVPYAASFIIAFTWPESPTWLAETKQFDKSREAFYWLRGRTEEATREIEELIRVQSHKRLDKSISEHIVEFGGKFKKKNFLKPLFVILISEILEETGGRHVFPSYASQIIQEIMSTGVNQFYFHIVIDALIAVSGFVSSYLIRVLNVRTLLFTTGTAALLALFSASLSLYLVKTSVMFEKVTIMPIVLFGMYFVLSNLGCTCVPLALKGEIFPLEHKVVASIAAYLMTALIASVSIKLMPLMVATFYMYGTFFIVALCMGVSLLLLYFILPETKDRTLLEIEHYFTHGQYTDGEPVPTHEQSTCKSVLLN